MIKKVTMQPEDEAEQEVQQEAQAQPVAAAENPYASQADIAPENRIWPPPFVKKHG